MYSIQLELKKEHFGVNWETVTVEEIEKINAKAKDEDGVTPLHLAACWGASVDIINALVHNGASVNARDGNGIEPLHWAKTDEVAKALLHHGADVNAKNKDGYTPLVNTVLFGLKAVAEVLIHHGADVNAHDDEDITLLHLAIIHRSLSIADLLIRNGANVNAQDNNGNTPLHYSVLTPLLPNIQPRYRELVKLLLENGAIPLMKNKDSRNALKVGEDNMSFRQSDAYFLLQEATNKQKEQ